ncbi:hypothetical protein [Specibacter sp. NPDC078692]|uniref:NACHT domain-containing protein n=1 Tax=Specibacter sp. NPDC078692 TaxID=3155818 RepID=UPI003434AE5C
MVPKLAEDYPLEQLSPRAFEQLTVALATQILGPAVEAFGAGPDGGREATYRGSVNWSNTSEVESDIWNGYVVIQAKQKMQPDADPGRNAKWLRDQIESELNDWEDQDKNRGEFPNFIIFVTNVRLSSVAHTGGIDAINRYIEGRYKSSLKERGLRGWKVWHRDQLNSFLSVYGEIRAAFPAMLTAGDIIWRFEALSDQMPSSVQLREMLIEHAEAALLNERWVNFSEAGGDNRESIETVVIDLPVSSGDLSPGFALKTIIQQGERVLRKSYVGDSVQRHIVLTGAPGNGKSTLSKFITQVYRTAFISMTSVTPTIAALISGTTEAEMRLQISRPQNVRWPFRVNLADYADEIGPDGDKSLLRWISEKITRRATENFTPSLLNTWLRVWPWLLVLDGLDEVTMPEVRRRVLDEIELFVEKADQLNADLLVVVTTRPTGYTERVAPKHFRQVDLGYLELSKALEYGTRAIQRRLSSDYERQDSVLANFGKAVRNVNAKRLLKTPLQVLILTYILEKLGTLPADRYQLFWGYFGAVYDREASKQTSLSSLFSRHRTDIVELHERVGLDLQIQAETLGEATSKLPLSQLRQMAVDRMREVGYESPGEAEKISDQIVQAATHRLVLLVADVDETVAFEVRSLQELMAARAIGAGSEAQIRERLLVTAPSPHWRNTWVFVAGRVFSEGSDFQREQIADLVSRIDDVDALPSWLCPVGPELAADILDDGLAVTKPKWEKKFVDIALRTLSGAIPRDVRGMAIGLSTAAEEGDCRTRIRNALKDALASKPSSVAVARLIISEGLLGLAAPFDPGPLPDYVSMLSGWRNDSREEVALGDLLESGLTELEDGYVVDALVSGTLGELNKIRFAVNPESGLWLLQGSHAFEPDQTLHAFDNEKSREIIQLLFGNLEPSQWQAQAVLARKLWPYFTRRPVGDELRSTFSHPPR